MKLRFEVDQAACLRKGIDCPKSIVTVEVDPTKLPQDERDLIADRLSGIDVYELAVHEVFVKEGDCIMRDTNKFALERTGTRIMANGPTFDELMMAIRANDKKALAELKRKPTQLLNKARVARELGITV